MDVYNDTQLRVPWNRNGRDDDLIKKTQSAVRNDSKLSVTTARMGRPETFGDTCVPGPYRS